MYASVRIIDVQWPQLAVMVLYQPPVQGNYVAAVPIAGLVIAQLVPAYFHMMRIADSAFPEDLDL